MTLHVPLSQEAEDRLQRYAATTGRDLPDIVAEAIEEKLSVIDDQIDDQEQQNRSAEQWIAELHAWAASHPRLDHFIDDSRESIYAGRGE